VWRFGALPAGLYLAFFVLYTYPRITQLFSHFWGGEGDAQLSLWNLWWADYSLTHLHQSPWFTHYLHFPHGTTLVTHSLCLSGTVPGIPLVHLLGLTPAYNLLLLGSFVGSGLTTFWLAWRVTRSYPGALLAGFIFAFSNYHFAHAEGHLDLITLQWMPLFLLCWVALLQRSTVWWGAGAALSLTAVFFSDYYYALYAALAALILTGAEALRRRSSIMGALRRHWKPLTVFALTAFAAMGPILVSYWRIARTGAIPGHGSRAWSLDALGLFIPGGHWRFAALTRGFWEQLPGNPHEKSVHLGLAVLALASVAVAQRRRSGNALGRWLLLAGVAAVFALGPRLQVWGRIVAEVPMPYSVAIAAVPFLGTGGTPVRLAILVTLAMAIAAAWGAQHLLASRRGRWVFGGLLALLLVEYWPQNVPATMPAVPPYVAVLAADPGGGAVLDLSRYGDTTKMYFQTIYRRPLLGGFISRVPIPVRTQTEAILQRAASGDADGLAALGVGSVVVPADQPSPFPALVPIYRDRQVMLFTLAPPQ